MISQNDLSRFQQLAVFFLLLTVFLFIQGHFDSALSQETQRAREFNTQVPSSVPIRIEPINLEKEDWPQGFGFKIINTGKKPIYGLLLIVYFPELKKSENYYGYVLPIIYGRHELNTPEGFAQEKDISIAPGENFTFTLSENQLKGFGKYLEMNQLLKPRIVSIMFQGLNYGDGTGFYGLEASPYPYTKQNTEYVPRKMTEPDRNLECSPPIVPLETLFRMPTNDAVGILFSQLNEACA